MVKLVASFRGMHVSPRKHSYICMCDYQERVTTGQTDRQTDRQKDGQTDAGQSDPYVPLCFAGDTKIEEWSQSNARLGETKRDKCY